MEGRLRVFPRRTAVLVRGHTVAKAAVKIVGLLGIDNTALVRVFNALDMMKDFAEAIVGFPPVMGGVHRHSAKKNDNANKPKQSKSRNGTHLALRPRSRD